MGGKILYNLKGIGMILTPRALTQARLESKIANIFTLSDKELETIAARVAHYHKISVPFSVQALPHSPTHPRLSLSQPHFGSLGENKLSKEHSSVYFYDSYEWTRYFPDSYVWNYEFSDVNYYLTTPAITKTRPIDSRVDSAPESSAQNKTSSAPESSLESTPLDSRPAQAPSPNNHNSIILQLEKHRHFGFIHDPIPYERKRDLLFFRGACPQEHRSRFLQMYFAHPRCDLGHTGSPSEHPAYTKPKISKQEHLHYKFLLSLEGHDVASNLKWVLGSNSLCVMPRPRYESWFMEEKLVENVHYALLDDDYGNLDSVLEFFLSHESAAKEIIHNANEYCARFQNPRIEAACNLLVLRKYFYLSGQGDLSADERALLGL